jgi:hypothetical protein
MKCFHRQEILKGTGRLGEKGVAEKMILKRILRK